MSGTRTPQAAIAGAIPRVFQGYPFLSLPETKGEKQRKRQRKFSAFFYDNTRTGLVPQPFPGKNNFSL
jgi:hypothetical protein